MNFKIAIYPHPNARTVDMKVMFYVSLGMQLFGMAAVGLCLFAGLKNGDYGRLELAQLIIGSFVFYAGTYLKGKYTAS